MLDEMHKSVEGGVSEVRQRTVDEHNRRINIVQPALSVGRFLL